MSRTFQNKLTAISLTAVICVLFLCMPAVAALKPEASGKTVLESGGVTVDASNVSKGYVMVKYSGKNSKIKIQISKSKTVYTYNINSRDRYEVFPLTEGDGSYSIAVFENVSGSQYAQVFGKSVTVKLDDAFSPFLYPNQYVSFFDGSSAVKTAASLKAQATTETALVEAIYNYVINNISYDTAKASSVQSGYLPNVDNTLSTKKGICFDYASLMAAMLRSQGIPTKLVVGYAGDIYHAWINVHITDVGWIDNMIYFDGKNWSMMDPTFASSGKGDPAVMQYIGDGANYRTKYTY